MANVIELEATDLASMLCSRVCHDLLNPVGAIGNGLEMLDDPSQAGMAEASRSLIASSAKQARVKLEFARLAYGASSSKAGSQIDTRECERVARLLFEIEKAELDWQVPLIMLPKNKAKLFMNMLLIAATSVPRGGKVVAKIEGATDAEVFTFTSSSDAALKQRTLMPASAEALLSGNPPEGVDARGIQPFYTGMLARMSDMSLDISLLDGEFRFAATPQVAAATAEIAPPETAPAETTETTPTETGSTEPKASSEGESASVAPDSAGSEPFTETDQKSA